MVGEDILARKRMRCLGFSAAEDAGPGGGGDGGDGGKGGVGTVAGYSSLAGLERELGNCSIFKCLWLGPFPHWRF